MPRPPAGLMIPPDQHPATLLQQLIRYDTTNPPGNEADCVGYVDRLLAEAGIATRLFARDPARPNLVARLPGRGDAPPLLLYGHVDVATTAGQAWRHPPFDGVVEDGFVWGRGVLDMKGGIAMMLAAILRARSEATPLQGDVLLVILSDEEGTGAFGAKYLVEEHADRLAGVHHAIGEFGGFTVHAAGRRLYPIQVAERRSGLVTATLRGDAGHANLPFRGGTMAKLGRLLTVLDQQPLPARISPVVRLFAETAAAALPSVPAAAVRQLLDPAQADTGLDRLRAAGEHALAALCEPMFRNTVNAVAVRRADENLGVIPSQVIVDLVASVLPSVEPADLVMELRGVLGEEVELEAHLGEPGPAEPDMGLFGTLGGILGELDPGAVPAPWVMPAVTDGRFFARLGIQTYGFLPMALPEGFDFARTIHAADERVPVAALDFGAEAIFRLLQRYGHPRGPG